MNLKIGFIDDDTHILATYKKRFARRLIDMVYLDTIADHSDLDEWLLKEQICCALVDYKLNSAFMGENGTDMVAYINSIVPDLPCVLITNYTSDAKKSHMMIDQLIIERDLLLSDDLSEIITMIQHWCAVFENRKQKRYEEYKLLLDKKKSEQFNSAKLEERFLELYKLLRAYGDIDDLPLDLLTSATSKKMDALISNVNSLIEKFEHGE